MCVLATTGPDGPLATPVRYYPLGFAVLFTAAPRSPKLRNIAADPRVSVGIFAPLVGLASSRGAQLFGTAKVLAPDHPDRADYWAAFRWENEHAERGSAAVQAAGRHARGRARRSHCLYRTLATARRLCPAPVLAPVASPMMRAYGWSPPRGD